MKRLLSLTLLTVSLSGCDMPSKSIDYTEGSATNHTFEITERFDMNGGGAYVLRDKKTGSEYLTVYQGGIIRLEGRGK